MYARASPISLSVFAITFLLLASCATTTEDVRDESLYAREDKRIQAHDKFARRGLGCNKSGGAMQIRKPFPSRITRHNAYEYDTAECVKY
jgi:hypothetical protein